MARPKLALLVDKKNNVGWTSIQIVRSLDSFADTFDLQILARGSSADVPDHNLAEEDECQILYEDQVLISGWIDRVAEFDDANSRRLTVSGRSRAGTLVDCTPPFKPWRNAPLLKIAEQICEPFEISVACDVVDIATVTERYFKMNEGETAFAAIDRLVRGHGMRATSKPDGSVLLTRTGVRRVVGAAVERGINVVSASFTRSCEERFSPYIFKSQVACTDDVNGGAASARSTVLDEGVKRYRPLVVERDTQGRTSGGQFTSDLVTQDLVEAAEWERNTRAGKSRQLTYEIKNAADPARSWEEVPGLLWEPNTIVTVRDPRYEIDGEFLIVEVRFTLDNGGTRTTLRMTAPEAYQPKKPPKKKTKKKGYSF